MNTTNHQDRKGGGSQPAGRLKALTLGDILTTTFPIREHLITPWLKQGESAMIFAPAGVGKSMFTLTLALAVAGGGEAMDWKAPRPYRVLFVDGEMHIDDIQSRALMLLETVNGLDQEATLENLTIIARQYQEGGTSFPDLAEEEGQETLIQTALRGNFDLAILDNLSTLATIEDENSAGQFNGVIQFLMRMKQEGKACILIHHANKGGRSFRGSTKLATTFEVIIGLEQLTGSKAQHGTAFTLKWDKYRGVRDGTTGMREMWLDTEKEPPAWEHQPSASEEIMLVLENLRSLDFTTQDELREALPGKPSAGKMSKLKAKAIAEGRITQKEWDECLSQARKLRDEDGESDY
jgi:hypothetical protein